ncbi:phospholipase (plasmid) [Cupriavidus necator]|uniref:Phospholipase n=1 Tax=Cupriavidus necator TaxID=106590 RepID=A0A367PQP4_CUPNE|nr:phospholipase [Cupriavidus necator]QQX89490.1 phospholipase [Cupriavidus necator]RCJ09376.1 phospholipase [Cupriavidus necator]
MTNQDITFSDLEVESQSGLLFRKRSLTGKPRARLLLLHGVGGNESNLAALGRYLPPNLEVLLLRAPRQVGPQGYAWFQVHFTSEGPRIDAQQADSSRRLLLSFLDALPPLPTVIAGFSQGGILSASVGLSAPQKVEGFGLLSGRILPELEKDIAPAHALASLSAFIAHGRHDDKLPQYWADQANALLERLAVPHQTHFYDMGHEIIAEEVTDFVRWLNQTLHLD